MFKPKQPMGLVAFMALMAVSQTVLAAPTLGSGGGAAFAPLRTWLQNFVDFMAGPFGLAVVILSVILGFAAWAMLPKEGIVGTIMRVVVAGVVIINVGTWVATFAA